MDQHCLGALLLENPLVREEDLERCLEIQELTGGTRPLGQILVEEGVLDAAALEELLVLQEERRQGGSRVDAVDYTGPRELLQAACDARAEELVLSQGRPAFVRVGNDLQAFTSGDLGVEEQREMLSLLGGGDLGKAGSRTDFALPGLARGRLMTMHHAGGWAVVVRLHPEPARELGEVALDEDVAACLESSQGLVLVAGEMRSGVTETLGALLARAVGDKDRLVLVLDEELEYPEPQGEALVVHQRVGEHTPTYETGLRGAISQDADVVFVGDASAPEVFDLCLRIAESGRLVVAATRARSVVGALERALSSYCDTDAVRVRTTLAGVLRCVVAVQLLPSLQRPALVMANEVLRVDDVAREVLREGELSQINLLMRLEGALCGHSMDHSLLELHNQGEISFQDAFGRAEDKTQVFSLTRGGV